MRLRLAHQGGLRLPLLVLGVLATCLSTGAQKAPPQQGPGVIVPKETVLVLVDAVVTDQNGKPVEGLGREEFEVKEEGKAQDIAVFQWSARTQPRPSPTPLPPHVFTNQPEYHPPRGPLTIVLLDALNTPRTDQVFMGRQMVRYFSSSSNAGQWTAVLALTDALRVLQDFTTDRELLMAAVKNYNPLQSGLLGVREQMTSRESDDEFAVLLQELKACGGSCEPLMQLIADLQRFEENVTAQSDQERMQLTLAALRAIANAVIGYPGRKNLIWVSSAFPTMYWGDKTGASRWSGSEELRQTAQLLNNARIAVYPVDPRGLATADKPESYDEFVNRIGATRPPDFQMGSPPPVNVSESAQSPAGYLYMSQSAMKGIAESTGGQAFYNRNDLANAVALAVADGSAYYTLGYYPKDTNWDGKFRRIEVKLARKGLRMRYRTGYYAIGAARSGQQATGATAQASAELQAALYDPFPATGITFRAHLPPPKPAAAAQVRVEFWLDKQSVLITDPGDGTGQLDLDYVVAAFSPDGKPVKNVGKRLRWSLKAQDRNQAIEHGMMLPARIELPPGKYQLRLLLRDNHTGQLGRVDAPLTVPSPATAPGQ